MQFSPLRERVALRRVASETKTTGGILIPENAAGRRSHGCGSRAGGEGRKIVAMD